MLSSKELGSKKPKEIGKVDGNPYYSLKEAMSYGLFSYNCRHRFIKYIPGQKITPQYQYDSKAAEAKREIDTNMRTLERQIRMLKEREVLSLDPKERKAYIKASKQAQAKYRAYAQKHGRVINEWRCSITRSERAFNKEQTSQTGKPSIMPQESEKLSEEVMEKINARKEFDEFVKDNPKCLNEKSPSSIDNQLKHFLGTKQNDKAKKEGKNKSWFTISYDELISTIKKELPNMEIRRMKDGSFKATFDFDDYIAYNVDEETNEIKKTKRVKIHFNSKGFHAVPTMKGVK